MSSGHLVGPREAIPVGAGASPHRAACIRSIRSAHCDYCIVVTRWRITVAPSGSMLARSVGTRTRRCLKARALRRSRVLIWRLMADSTEAARGRART